jgi:hypothetical protein
MELVGLVQSLALDEICLGDGYPTARAHLFGNREVETLYAAHHRWLSVAL